TMKGVGVSTHSDPLTDPINQNYDFRGRPNNGDISVGVMANESTLSGNPYPSALDLFLVFWDADNTEIQMFKFWDEDRSINSHLYRDNKGGYGTWIPGSSNYATVHTAGGIYTRPTFLNYDNGGNPSGGDTGMGLDVSRLYAPIGQGFNIFADIAGDGQIIYKNSHRVYETESGSPFANFRSSQDNSGRNPNAGIDPSAVNPYDGYPPTLRFYTIFEDSHMRDMVLTFNPESTDGYDRGMDARHPMDAAKAEVFFPIIHTDPHPIGTFPYVIQSLPYELTKRVPLTFEVEMSSTRATIMSVDEINLPSRVYLYDSVDNTYQEITGGNRANIQLTQGDYEDRFFLVFRGRDDTNRSSESNQRTMEIEANVDFFQNNPVAQLEVSNPEGYNIKSAMIFDMSGKLVLNQNDLGDSTRFTFSTATFSDGVYIVKLTTSENVVIDYKMTVHNKR
ncbi:MAG: T9SS type A sorting domain-containing protein, partial [Flavobacteriaceae bacterium]|nr:T9SS type A sorting domain-containing protein [Flavobacteriaceae bacterium]